MIKILKTFLKLVLVYYWILFISIMLLVFTPLELHLPYLPLYFGPLFALFAAGIYHTEKIWKWMLAFGLIWFIPSVSYLLFFFLYAGGKFSRFQDILFLIMVIGALLSIFGLVSLIALLTKRYQLERKMMWIGIILTICFGWIAYYITI